MMTLDTAALPSPPEFAPWKNPNRPKSLGGMQQGAEHIGGSDARQNGHHGPSRPPRFPNIKDLQDQAAALDVNDSTPVCYRN